MTKAEERKILGQIVALIESTPADSYIRSAFAGVPEYAERNIADDAAYNPVEERDRLAKDYADKVAECLRNEKEVAERYRKMEHEMSALEDNLKRTTEQLDQYKQIVHNQSEKIGQLSEELCTAAETLDARTKLMEQKNAEIMRLKAELYDYMQKERE